MTENGSIEQKSKLLQLAIVHLEEAQKLLDELKLTMTGARLDHVIAEVKAIEKP